MRLVNTSITAALLACGSSLARRWISLCRLSTSCSNHPPSINGSPANGSTAPNSNQPACFNCAQRCSAFDTDCRSANATSALAVPWKIRRAGSSVLSCLLSCTGAGFS